MRRYAVWYQRGYQEFETVTSATTTKLKGIAMTNYTQLNISLHGGVNGVRIWDVADYVVPPQVTTEQQRVVLGVVITMVHACVWLYSHARARAKEPGRG